MKHSESMAKIAPAIVAAQSELKSVSREKVNPYFKSKYADLAACMDILKPILSKNGLAVIQCPEESDKVRVDTTLLHVSGEWITCSAVCAPKDMAPQSVGSAITYLRRYGLAIIGLVTDDDDDGNYSSKQDSKRNVSEF
jgi:hypothetical protein